MKEGEVCELMLVYPDARWVRRLIGISALFLFLGAAAVMAQSREGFDLNEQALRAAGQGDQTAAERLYHQAIDIWRSLGPNYRAHLGTTEYNLGQTLCALGRRAEAMPLLEDGLRLLRATLGVRHTNTLHTMNYLAGLQLTLGDAAGAEALFREALTVERELFPKDTQLALTLGGLSSILVRENKAAEALPLAEEELRIALEAAGEQSLDAALAYANVATVHKWAGRYDRALPLYRKSLRIYQQLVGPEHPRTASVLSEIGLVEMEDRNYTLAEGDMMRALEIVGRSPGWNVEQWIGETNLGMLRFRQARYIEAARWLESSLRLEEQAGMHEGMDLKITLETLAKVREKQGRFDDAQQLRDRAAMVSAYR
jgi:tetratricopeptide (TPR) repeat protein